MQMSSAVISASAGVVLLFSPSIQAQTWDNPLEGDIRVHDPVMVKEGDTYYIFHTGNGVSIKRSVDRIRWENAGRVLDELPEWAGNLVPDKTDNHLWAPDVHYRNGTWYLYYSVSTFGSNTSAIGLVTNTVLDPDDPGYRWQDQGPVINTRRGENNYNAIDPNIIVDDDGIPWMNFGSFWSGIKLLELDPATGKPASGDPELFSIASRPGSGAVEAPFIIRRNGFYYLFVSFDLCCQGVNSTYKIMAGRSEELTGPYRDSEGREMTDGGGDLIDDGDERWLGPGHNAVYMEGDSAFLVNHAYDAERNGASILMIRPLYWDAGGWPTLDGSLAVSAQRHDRPGKKGCCQLPFYSGDMFDTEGIYGSVYDPAGRIVQQGVGTEFGKRVPAGIYFTPR